MCLNVQKTERASEKEQTESVCNEKKWDGIGQRLNSVCVCVCVFV